VREALRLRLPEGRVDCRDEGGVPLLDDPARALGDPVLQRRDGAIAYHLAVVVDDAADAISRVVRGRDLAPLTAIHRCLQQALGLAPPTYRHHLLLLEEDGSKLAKLHGSISWSMLAAQASGAEICGQLAYASGLLDAPHPVTARELLPEFTWSRVRVGDQLARWNGNALEFEEASLAALAD
jgi:glutamyl/glutaminyl-tRNA synthetase